MPELRVHRPDGVVLVGDEWGDPSGSPVLLLHGGGQSRFAWKGTAARLVDAGYFVVTMDARGHGDSSWSPEGRYEMAHLAGDLLAVLERFDRRPAVVGASMGGMSALMAQGSRADQLFSALVLVDVTPRMEMAGVYRILAFMTAHPDGFESLEQAADAIAAYNPHRARSPSVEGLRRVVRQGGDGRWRWLWDPLFISSKAEMNTDDPAAAEARMERMAAELYAAARRVAVPTLLVRGAQSDLVSDRSVTEFLAAVPHAAYVDVRGAGHMVAGDDNDAFTTAVVDFLHTHVGANPAEDALLAARDRAAAALRRLGHALVDRDADVTILDELAASAQALTDRLESTAPRDRLAEYLATDRIKRVLAGEGYHGEVAEGDAVDFSRHSLVGGAANPFGIDARYQREGDQVVARLTLGAAFEGPPGRAHGGVVSAVVDETMAALLPVIDVAAFTTRLELSYLGPTPLHTELEFRARLLERQGRDLTIECVGAAAERTFVRAEGRFVEVDLARFVSEILANDAT